MKIKFKVIFFALSTAVMQIDCMSVVKHPAMLPALKSAAYGIASANTAVMTALAVPSLALMYAGLYGLNTNVEALDNAVVIDGTVQGVPVNNIKEKIIKRRTALIVALKAMKAGLVAMPVMGIMTAGYLCKQSFTNGMAALSALYK